MDVARAFCIVAGLAFVALAIYELRTGKAFTTVGAITRGKNPYGYAVVVLTELLVGVYAVVIILYRMLLA